MLPIPAADLVAATTEVAAHRPDPGIIPLPFLPVLDGVFLPEHPLTAVQRGSAADVDLIVGTNRDELTLFALGNPAFASLDDAAVARWVTTAAPDVPTDEVLAAYREARQARGESVTARDLWVSVGTDNVFRWPSLQLAAAQRASGAGVFVYLFDWESPAFGGVLGSCHGLEIPFVFGAVGVPAVQLLTGAGPEVEALSARMQAAWLSFARSGDRFDSRRTMAAVGSRYSGHHALRRHFGHGGRTPGHRVGRLGALPSAGGGGAERVIADPG